MTWSSLMCGSRSTLFASTSNGVEASSWSSSNRCSSRRASAALEAQDTKKRVHTQGERKTEAERGKRQEAESARVRDRENQTETERVRERQRVKTVTEREPGRDKRVRQRQRQSDSDRKRESGREIKSGNERERSTSSLLETDTTATVQMNAHFGVSISFGIAINRRERVWRFQRGVALQYPKTKKRQIRPKEKEKASSFSTGTCMQSYLVHGNIICCQHTHTRTHTRRHLFFGVCINDVNDHVAASSVASPLAPVLCLSPDIPALHLHPSPFDHLEHTKGKIKHRRGGGA